MFPDQVLTLIELNGTALKPEIKQWLIDTLNMKDIHNPHERYREECIK